MNKLGVTTENLAANYLTAQGLQIKARNWQCRFGEIDLIAIDGDTIVFVEVRRRTRSKFGDAATSITPAKQAKLMATAQLYLATLRNTPPCRFDAILLDGNTELRWLKNIIQY